MTIIISVYALIVAALTFSQYHEGRAAEAWLKPAAALGFILIALLGGALYWHIGLWLLGGLFFCAIGDICLIPQDKPSLFRAGMAAFAAGHICYIIAMLAQPHNPIPALIALPFMAAISAVIYNRLKPGLPEDLGPVMIVYMGIISLMAAASFATQNPAYIIAATAFAISDIYVGRDRFEAHKPSYALIITPLYFSAQGIFACLAAISNIG